MTTAVQLNLNNILMNTCMFPGNIFTFKTVTNNLKFNSGKIIFEVTHEIYFQLFLGSSNSTELQKMPHCDILHLILKLRRHYVQAEITNIEKISTSSLLKSIILK